MNELLRIALQSPRGSQVQNDAINEIAKKFEQQQKAIDDMKSRKVAKKKVKK